MEKSHRNLFLTGKAGTGKSTLLEYFKAHTDKKVAILAPTGVAAVNVGGETIHAFFGLKPGFELPEAKEKSIKPKNPSLYKRVETIIIDEISMVRADLLDAIDIFLRNARKRAEPFGGVQMIFIGDLYQLPPVLTNEDKKVFYEEYGYKSPYFFDAEVFRRDDFSLEYIELDTIYRQNDRKFIDLLNAVRNNSLQETDIIELNKRFDETFYPDKDSGYIALCTTNKDANAINEKNLEEIHAPEYFFYSKAEGEVQKNQYPTDELLIVKEGAQIIFLNNDSERKWVNGSLGKIIRIHKDLEYMEIETNEKTVKVEPYSWEISKYVIENGTLNRKILGSFTQFPIRLAWAITIHKSQGKTFEKVVVDFGRGTFAHGQAYTALSRCVSFEGLVLKKKLKKTDVKMDYKIQTFITQFHCDASSKILPESEKKRIIENAILNKQPIKITYLKAKDEKSIRKILPYTIEKMHWNTIEFLGISAFCYQTNEDRNFSLKRILWIEE